MRPRIRPWSPIGPPVSDSIQAALGRLLGGEGWAVTPLGGSTGRAILATGPQTVVVRLEARADVAARLDRLGVGPRVLAASDAGGRPFVVHEHVAGEAPSPGWIAAHASDVASLIDRYARDPVLAELAEPLTPGELARQLTDGAAGVALSAAERDIVEGVVASAASVPDVPLGASHGDPNGSNIIVAGDRLLLVDWDDLRRADPLRDLGQVAWWYLPPAGWPAFMAAAGLGWDPGVEARLFWWVAAESVDVALRLLPGNPDAATSFFGDARAALDGHANPRRVS